MTAIAWTAFGALSTTVTAHSGSLLEILNYSMTATAVCASLAALVALSGPGLDQRAEQSSDETIQNQIEALKLFADQTGFADSRIRLLTLSQRFEQRGRGSD